MHYKLVYCIKLLYRLNIINKGISSVSYLEKVSTYQSIFGIGIVNKNDIEEIWFK